MRPSGPGTMRISIPRFVGGNAGASATEARAAAPQPARRVASPQIQALAGPAGRFPGLAPRPGPPLAARRLHAGVAGASGNAAGEPPNAGPPPLAHWNRLTPGRSRDYAGTVYERSIVKRVYPDEVYGWEHGKTTPTLVGLAEQDAWESHAVPPISLAYCEEGVNVDGRILHFAIVDGHHRLNAARHASAGSGAVGVPAVVTARWAPNAQGQLIGYGGAPQTAPDASAPSAWNRSARAQTVHAPESIRLDDVWSTRQITLTLPGSSNRLSLADIANKLNAFKRPNEFLSPSAGQTVRVRVSLQDVHGRPGASGKHGDLSTDLAFNPVDLTATDWASILQDTRPLAQLLGPHRAANYPIVQVQLQQSPYVFQTD